MAGTLRRRIVYHDWNTHPLKQGASLLPVLSPTAEHDHPRAIAVMAWELRTLFHEAGRVAMP